MRPRVNLATLWMETAQSEKRYFFAASRCAPNSAGALPLRVTLLM
jgi:hypothetical protein